MPQEPDGATWCARPRMLLSAGSPEDLAAAVRAAHSQVVPDPLLLVSPEGDPARVRRLGKLEERTGAARRRPKARERRRVSPPPGSVPLGVAGRFGQRPAAPLGAPGELGPGGLGLCPGRWREKSPRLTGAGLLPAAAGRGVPQLDVKGRYRRSTHPITGSRAP